MKIAIYAAMAVALSAGAAFAGNNQSQGQGQGQAQAQVQGQAQYQKSVSNSNADSSNQVSVDGDERAASSAYAPGLTAGVNPCALSYSGGVQAMDFGISLGGVVNHEGCEDRANIATLVGLGERDAAVVYACQNSEKMAKALGQKCGVPQTASVNDAALAPTSFDAALSAVETKPAERPDYRTRWKD